jgi:hypothetical protein
MSSVYKKNIKTINCTNNLLVGDTRILWSDNVPITKILVKNNFTKILNSVKMIINIKETLPPIKGMFLDEVYF